MGYDTRFEGEAFAKRAATVFASMGIPVRLSDSFVTTPAVSWAPGSAQGEILGTALEHLLSQLPQLDRDAAAALAAGFTGLVGGLLLAEGELLRNRYAETSRADAMLAADSKLMRLISGPSRPWVVAFGGWLLLMGLLLNPQHADDH